MPCIRARLSFNITNYKMRHISADIPKRLYSGGVQNVSGLGQSCQNKFAAGEYVVRCRNVHFFLYESQCKQFRSAHTGTIAVSTRADKCNYFI